jgi:hypothetical protein
MPANHPLRGIRIMTDDALRRMSQRFEALYASTGRPSVPPEQLLRALLLRSFTRGAASGCSWSNSNTTCCSDGL